MHDTFIREGNDLVTKLTISLGQALCGFEIQIPFLGGETRLLRSSNIITPGQMMRVPGSGMPISKEPGKKGDLIVKLDIRFPTSLSADEKIRLNDVLRSK